MVIRLSAAGRDDFVVLEHGASLGGTWRDNTIPAAPATSPRTSTRFRSRRTPDWTRTYSRAARDRGLPPAASRTTSTSAPSIRLRYGGHRRGLGRAHQRWTGRSPTGGGCAPACSRGPPARPATRDADIEGPSASRVQLFDSAEWDHDYDLNGKRVAVIGTGASALQFVPAIAPDVAHLHVFQRTAPWICPRSTARSAPASAGSTAASRCSSCSSAAASTPAVEPPCSASPSGRG